MWKRACEAVWGGFSKQGGWWVKGFWGMGLWGSGREGSQRRDAEVAEVRREEWGEVLAKGSAREERPFRRNSPTPADFGIVIFNVVKNLCIWVCGLAVKWFGENPRPCFSGKRVPKCNLGTRPFRSLSLKSSEIFFRPIRGSSRTARANPRLTPWANFFRPIRGWTMDRDRHMNTWQSVARSHRIGHPALIKRRRTW